MKELYDKWLPDYERSVKSEKTIGVVKAAWKYCSSIYDLPVKELRPRHVKYCMEEGTLTYLGETRKASVSMQLRIKSMLNQMMDYALEKEIVDKNYARDVTGIKELKEKEESEKEHHIAFTPEEIEILWQHTDMPYVAAILINIYSGWRPQELGNILLANTDLNAWTFSGGMKTEAGKRTVPIHTKIRELVKIEADTAEALGCKYLIPYYTGRPNRSSDPYHFDYKRYQTEFYKIVKTLGLNESHKPHDCRKTFVTLAKNSKVDEYAIKYMVGHKITDITEKTYTEREMDFYREEIEKIK